MLYRRRILLLLLGLLLAVATVWGVLMLKSPTMVTEQVSLPSLADVPRSAWDRLADQRIYFGHQSVGDNVVAGLQDIMRDNAQIRLRILQTSNLDDFALPVFAHSRLGQNGDPRSKLRAFAALLDGGLADRVDIAMFKFCYVDLTASTDVDALFAEYRTTMDRLRQSYPRVTLVHVIVPLTVRRMGPKAWAKQLLGRPDDNCARARFNALLVQEYAGRAPVYDLAACEATARDGTRMWYESTGCRVYQLLEAYTTDGGHLNEGGRQAAASQFLKTLAS